MLLAVGEWWCWCFLVWMFLMLKVFRVFSNFSEDLPSGNRGVNYSTKRVRNFRSFASIFLCIDFSYYFLSIFSRYFCKFPLIFLFFIKQFSSIFQQSDLPSCIWSSWRRWDGCHWWNPEEFGNIRNVGVTVWSGPSSNPSDYWWLCSSLELAKQQKNDNKLLNW